MIPGVLNACIGVVNPSFVSQELMSRSGGTERKNDEKESWRQAANFKKVRRMEGELELGVYCAGNGLKCPPLPPWGLIIG